MPKRVQSLGFTIIELLIVISVLAILFGLTLSLLNPQKQKERAEDGVRLANVEKLVHGIESYNAAEGLYPDDADSDGNPIDNIDDPLLTYLTFWPNDEPIAGTLYTYWVSADLRDFGVLVVDSTGENSYKYRSDWTPPKLQTCANLEADSSECN